MKVILLVKISVPTEPATQEYLHFKPDMLVDPRKGSRMTFGPTTELQVGPGIPLDPLANMLLDLWSH